MGIFRRSSSNERARRSDLLAELERFARRLLVVPVAAPLFLLVGFGLGEVSSVALALPEYEADRPIQRTPRTTLDLIGRTMADLRRDGEATTGFVSVYQEHVAPVEKVLAGRGVPAETARKVAWPLVEHSYRNGLDPATVLAVLWIESRGKPDAVSPVGARGLMQVMPMHAGRWVGCGRDLYDIEANLCNGTRILAWYLGRSPGDERRAFLGYNGCVRGTNTPDCFLYPDKVWRLRSQIERELTRQQSLPPRPGAAASP